MTLLRALFLILALAFTSGQARAVEFTLKGVDFSDSAYLSDAALEAAAAPYVNRPIGFEDLQKLVADVQALYSNAGVLTAQVVLPPQEIADGILHVSLVEATVSELHFEGLDRTKAAFMERNLSFRIGERPDFEALERDLRIFDIAHDIAPQIRFGPGTAPGTAAVTVTATEPKRFEWTLSLDNFGREETGLYRASVFGRWSSVSGWRDTLSVQAQVAEAAYSVSLGYSRPVGPRGGRVIATVSGANSQIIQGPFSPVDVISDTMSASLGYRIPFRVRPDRHWIFEGGLAFDKTNSQIEDLPFSDITVREIYLSASHARQTGKALLGYSMGLKVGRADAKQTSETEGNYRLLFGSVTYSRPLGKRLMFEADVQGQYAQGENLPVARLFSVGGPTSVRGYPNSVRTGDSGVVARLQLSAAEALRPFANKDIGLKPFGFFDAAVVVPYRVEGGINSEQDILASIGAGLRVDFREKASGLLMVAVPLRNTLGFTDKGSATAYVGLDYRF